MIIYEELRIEGAFELQTLLSFEMDVEPNKHGTAMIKGFFSDINNLERWQQSGYRHIVKIYKQRDGRLLFVGEVYRAKWEYESGLYIAKLDLITASAALDKKLLSASFQDVSMTYEAILKKAFEPVAAANCSCTIGKGMGPQSPVIQYRETAWEFAMRLASHLNMVIYPKTDTETPCIWFGIPENGGEAFKIKESEYIHGISETYYELGGNFAGLEKSDFEYFRIKSREDYPIGAKVEYQGNAWLILEKHARLERGEILYTYLLGKNKLISVVKRYNRLFAGMSILGTVLKTDGERVKLHLDIDKEQSVETAYPYKWVPDTGSVMYCMPEVGTVVSLYFSSTDETSAIAVSCVRKNGDTCQEMGNTDNRTLTTSIGKRMYLNPDTAGFDIRESGHQVMVEDNKGITLESAKKINIIALQGIEMKADTVVMETPQEISLVRGVLQ